MAPPTLDIPPAWHGPILNGGFLAMALLFNTFTAPMVKFTQQADGSYSYNKACIYFFAELLKLVVSVAWCVWQSVSNPDMRAKMRFTQRDVLQYAIPGFVFFSQNNLSFVALQHMTNSAFQLLLNMRIISVALLSVAFLKKKLTKTEWLAILLLTNGAVQHQLSHCEQGTLRSNAEGLVVMLVIIICAAGGNVATQLVMQKNMEQPLMLQNAILYVWGIVFNGINWFYSVQGANGEPTAAYGDIGFSEVSLIIFSAVYGLSISVILKRFGAITRTFISTIAIICTALVDVFLFGATINILESTTFVSIIASVFLFSVLGKPPPFPASDHRYESLPTTEPTSNQASATKGTGGGGARD